MKILQIGCYDGNDHVYEYVSSNKDKITELYLIEPLSEALIMAKQLYSKLDFVKFYEMAIVDDDINEVEFFYPKNIQEGQTSSINKNHSKLFQTEMISKKILAIKLDKFLEKHQIFNLDRLYIDTEGLDCKILNSLDLNRFNISFIEYEYIHSDGTHNFGPIGEALERKLESHGYKIYNSLPFNKIAIK
jgi:FkbM family methyltransferase